MKKSIMFALVALMSAALISCGGGPLEIWRVSSTDKPEVCTPKLNTAPDDTKTTLDGSTWEIYKGTDDKYFLLIGGKTSYEGTKDGKKYTFKGESKKHEPWSTATQITTTITETYELEVKGKNLTGTRTWKKVKDCAGTCNSDAGDRQTCDSKDDIHGIKVDPDVEYHI